MLTQCLRLVLFTILFIAGAASTVLARPVSLAWDPNAERDIAGYVVHYGNRPGVYTASVNVGKRTSWTFPNLADDLPYYFTVRAYNTAGMFSQYSREIVLAALPARIQIDAPGANAHVPQPFAISGWALDLAAPSGSGVDAVQVWAYPNPGSGAAPYFLGPAQYGLARPDVAGAFGARFQPSGYRLDVSGVRPGPYRIDVFARSAHTGAYRSKSVYVNVAAGPVMSVDAPGQGTLVWPIFTVAGWAADLRAPSGTGVSTVHVYAYPNPGSGTPPVFLGAATYGGSRPDVGALFGSRFTNSSYGLAVGSLTPGTYDIAAYARSTVSGTFNNARTARITIGPLVTIGQPTPGATVSGTWRLTGWAVDLRAATGTGMDTLHVWAFPRGGGAPRFLGATEYGATRVDVGNWLGARFAPSAYSLDVSGLPPGEYDVAVYGHSTVTKGFAAAQVVKVTVQ